MWVIKQAGRQEALLQSVKCTIPAGGATINIPFTEKEQTWDEFSPVMHTSTVTLASGSFSDQQTVSYAVRKIGTTEQAVYNERKTCFVPWTG